MGIPLRVIENWSIHCVNDTVMFIKYNLCLKGKIYVYKVRFMVNINKRMRSIRNLHEISKDD